METRKKTLLTKGNTQDQSYPDASHLMNIMSGAAQKPYPNEMDDMIMPEMV